MESGSDIFIRDDKVYVASLGEGGYGFARTEPIYIVDLDIEQLARALETVYRAGIRQLVVQKPPEPSHVDPLPLAVIRQSGREMDDDGLLYRVDWGSNATMVEVSAGRNGRWVDAEALHLAADLDCRALAKVIIDDARSHDVYQEKI
jgi:hypothetical protein